MPDSGPMRAAFDVVDALGLDLAAGDLLLHGHRDAADERGELDGDVEERAVAVQGLGVVVGAAGVDLLEHVGDHQAEGDVHLLVVGPGELHARAPTLTALLTRSERVILFSGLEVIVLIPFRGELGLGSAQSRAGRTCRCR